MRKIRNLVLFLFISMMLVITISGNDSVSAYRTDDEAADILYQMNLFKGTGTDTEGNPTFELDRVSTRYEAITMLVRLSGNEEKALTENYEMPFTDVVDWAKPYVAFAYANGYTSGTSATTFSGDLKITEEQFITMLLRILGYDSSKDFAWDNPWPLSDEISLTQGSCIENGEEFARGNIAILSERALHCTYAGTDSESAETLMDKVHKHTWDDGVVTVEATTSREGTMLYTCTVCQVTKNEEIAKLEFVDEALVITDANLEAELRKEINKPTGTLMVSDFANVKTLVLLNTNITDITPLAKLTHLTKLQLVWCNITDITPLEKLTNLKELTLYNDHITDISLIANLTKLTHLYLDCKVADITPITELPNLTNLILRSDVISDITLLADMQNLTLLTLESDKITDLTLFANLQNLTHLNLHTDAVLDITPITTLPKLTNLYFNDIIITDLTQLENLTNLTYLSINYSNITDITPLSNLTNLTYLALNSNHITDITSLANLTNLTNLDIRSNNIIDIVPLANLTDLRDLYLDFNNITDITPLANLTNLRFVTLISNNVTDWAPVDHIKFVPGRP